MATFNAIDFVGVTMTHSAYICAIADHKESRKGGDKAGTGWPFNDPGVMARLDQSIRQAHAGDLKYLGSFAELAEE